ncbi:hypothetical protein D9613_010371 [Agrocybe pediades]|uniref:Fungal N-terminal domain-containing protein n=1 Tax=Agrocybe pediades TaxID=84607 RepID=A0A8H4QFE7_9AGAR|nr:hypothetical protein D9613_010371 [Agrocybe pediades]
MDPLSGVLAGITLATAVKDVVELAQKLSKSFKKPGRNLRAARELAGDVLDTTHRLKDFYESHQTILDQSQEMKHFLSELEGEMRTVYNKCCQTFPAYPMSKIGRIKNTVFAWRSAGKVERQLLNLKNRVNKCYIHFMMFAVMRIEVQITDMNQTLAEARISSNGQMRLTAHEVSDDSLVTFVGGNSETLSKLPPEISVDYIANSYLRLQIDTIDSQLAYLSSVSSFRVKKPRDVYLVPFRPQRISRYFTSDVNAMRQCKAGLYGFLLPHTK